MQTVEIVKALRLCAIDDCEKCNGVRYDDKMRCCTEALNLSAADRLEELLDRCKRYADEIMALREKQQWISVTERLPSEGMRVLAATEGVFSGEAYLSCEGVWMRSYGVVWVSLVDMPVTHWMPLPDAPEVMCDG